MSIDINYENMFPTSVGVIDNFLTEEERIDLLEDIKHKRAIHNPAFLGNATSSLRLENTFLNTDIQNRIQDSIDQYSKKYGCPRQKMWHYWFNIQDSNSVLTEHTHPNATLSGVLYLNVDDTCRIFFHTPNPYTCFVEKDPVDGCTEYTYEYYWMRVRNCQLIVFPSWLKHGKNDDVNQMDNRIAISFNTHKY